MNFFFPLNFPWITKQVKNFIFLSLAFSFIPFFLPIFFLSHFPGTKHTLNFLKDMAYIGWEGEYDFSMLCLLGAILCFPAIFLHFVKQVTVYQSLSNWNFAFTYIYIYVHAWWNLNHWMLACFPTDTSMSLKLKMKVAFSLKLGSSWCSNTS